MAYTVERLNNIKWPEVLSLVFLNIAVNISWLAYYEFAPTLLESFEITSWVTTLYQVKLFALVGVPVLAGMVLDRFVKVSKRALLVGTIGVVFTGLIFMLVTSTMVLGLDSGLASFLPVFVILWLIGMNIFVAPAHSYLREFSALEKLPIAMAVVVFSTDIIYALESVIVDLIVFVGPIITFASGGALVLISGLLFQYNVKNEIEEREAEESSTEETADYKIAFPAIILGFVVGACHAMILNLYPYLLEFEASEYFGASNSHFPAIIFGVSALLAFAASRFVRVVNPGPSFVVGMSLFIVSIVTLFFNQSLSFIIFSGIVCAAAYALLSVAALPLLFSKANVRVLGMVTGFYLGLTELVDSVVDIMQVM